ncbi:HAMP domain-containing protein [Clostridiaceae bacterium]|nr:HAMP domain-containing protein [Clostridiaceae bacterium]
MKLSIRTKFFAAICATSFVFVSILAALNLFFYDDYYLFERQKELADIYRRVDGMYDGNINSIVDDLIELENNAGVRLSIMSADLKSRYDSTLAQLTPEIGFSIFGGTYYRVNREQWGELAESTRQIHEVLANADTEELQNRKYTYVTTKSKEKEDKGFLCLVGQVHGGTEYLIARMPFTFMAQNSTFNSFFLMIASIFTLLICLLVGYLISRQFTRPLIQIGDVADSMARLDFSKKYEGNSKDEIGELGRSINLLSEHLEAAIGELQRSNNQLAEEIREKEKIDAMRREFIVNASHELKTPIALIQGYAEGLRLGVADNAEDRAYYCETIADEAGRMNTLVMQMLRLSKLELGRESPDLTELEVNELFTEAVRKTEVLWSAKGQQIELEPTKVRVVSDENLLSQVVMNYLTNAVRYAPDGGRILLYAAQEPDGGVTLAVWNEGEALAEEELQKIWEKFYRTDKARSRESGGSGIGLSIVKAIAETLHASCGAENRDGGIAFWFRIPPPADG